MKAKRTIIAALVAFLAIGVNAQQVSTLYFLENAPMRHTINPAFQPVSQGFINFSPLGWMSFSTGNNSLTMSDVLFVDPTTGMTITPLHPNANRQAFLNQLRAMTMFNGESTLGLINMGFRVKEDGYLTIGINERYNGGTTVPRSIFDFALGGGMKNLTGTNPIELNGLGAGTSLYAEIGVGYSHRLNEQWTIGGKLKVLLGQAYMGMNFKNLHINASTQEWRLQGMADVDIAAPIDAAYLGSYIDGKNMNQIITSFQDGSFDPNKLINTANTTELVKKVLVPSGYGAALDFGFTYKPIEQLQISAALTDLGFIYWNNSSRFQCTMDTTFTGAGQIDVNDPAYRDQNGNFSTQILMDTVKSNLMGLLNGAHMKSQPGGFARMTSARFNLGVDANFWDNRVGIGILSATRLYNSRLYEEITFGVAFRPCNWFNIAASYSLLNNGKYSNIGAGLSFMPYDGINLTLAMDYIPTSYAGMNVNGQTKYILPDKAKMVNVALGFSICWGSNRRDKDKDGVWDKIDLCPNTPRGVVVDSVGCPLDTDHDGVPDYLDNCPNTPAAAIGFVDSLGCSMDTDGDGVEDYKDRCPNTPKAAWGHVDSVGCELDTDHDGVPDYRDSCLNTPAAAIGLVDENGCELDTDHDGVPDYKDHCPNTPAEAIGMVDENGCELDTDGDGVADYRDACPNTTPHAIGFVDAHGCELDSDTDGVPDYMDECPHVFGVSANKGCPEIKREVRQLLQKAMQGIEFETGKATIKRKSYPLLDQIAQIFIDNSNYIIEVQGHTDNTGNAEVNQRLSEQRANAVMKYLISKGVPAERMTAVGYGQNVPLADNKTAAGRQKNRRVEFKITFEEVHIETILDHADEQ
jgi:outer membrane protein OmpA-like peptidoglycan-associated protein